MSSSPTIGVTGVTGRLGGRVARRLADAGATLLWQEPVSAFTAQRQQNDLEEAFAATPKSEPKPRQGRPPKTKPMLSPSRMTGEPSERLSVGRNRLGSCSSAVSVTVDWR